MSVFLQIGIGLIPAVLTLIVIMCLRKCFSVRNIIMVVCSVLLVVALIVGGVSEDTTADELSLSKDDMMSLAYAFVDREAWESVDKIIGEYSSVYGYDEECTLLRARSAAIQGDSKIAAALYRKVEQLNSKLSGALSKEINLVKSALAYLDNDPVTTEYIRNMGKNPEDYGIDTSVDKSVVDDMVNGVKQAVAEECKERRVDKNTKALAEIVAETDALYDNYIDNGGEQGNMGDVSYKEQAQQLVGRFETLADDYPDAFSVYPVRMSRLKASVLAEDYEKIAGDLDNYASYDELMIASELYMNGYITDKSFDETWRESDDDAVDVVAVQLEKNLDSGQLSDEEKAKIRERIEMFKATAEGKVLKNVESRLNLALNDSTIDADKSKVYLQKSKIDRYMGDEEAATENMLLAIDSAPNSTDDNYSYPMCEISGIISGTSDAEKVMNVATYVDQVVENSLTVQPTSAIFMERVTTEEQSGSDADGEGKVGFADYMEEQVSRYSTAVNIGMIDYSQFPDIKARIQLASEFIESESDAENSIYVEDCYYSIDDFTVKKIDFSESNIMLLCDNSGSMSGSIDELQQAVKAFVDSSGEDENISIVAFDSSILLETGFTQSESTLQAAIDSMDSRGGTDIYGSIQHGIEQFPYDPQANNVMIVMTDGQDGGRSYESMKAEIGAAAENKGIAIYTLGLGGVNAEYLTNIASVGGGDFVYASDVEKLEKLYEIIHGQAKNQYLLEYTAYDTLTVSDRELTVALKKEKISDTKVYSLNAGEDDDGKTVEIVENLYVHGFDVSLIYKSDQNTTVMFKGGGFKADEAISLTLDGSVDYELTAEFVDENTYSVVIPYGVAVDTYNLRVTIGKNSAVLPNELYVVSEEQKSITFGAYTFTANKIVTESDNSTYLSGVVSMNGWLRFNGDVRLKGDVKRGHSIVIEENRGACIVFDPATAKGMAKALVSLGWNMAIGSLDGVTLYNDAEHINNVKDYKVQQISNLYFKTLNLRMIDVDAMVYPDRLVIAAGNIATSLPFQGQFITALTGEDPFSVDIETESIINKSGWYAKLDVEYEDEGYFKGAKVFSTYVQLKEGEFHLDTLEEDISFKFMVQFGFLKETAVGLTLGWKGGYWDTALLHVDRDVHIKASVPVTLSDFSGGLKDMAIYKEEMSKERIWNSTLSLGTKLAVAKVSAFIKPMEKFFGDISLISTDDFELQLSLGRGYFSAKTDVMFLEEIKIASAELEFGNISYTNAMLGLEDVDATGVRAFIKKGIMYDKLDGLKIDVSMNGELSLHSRFCGVKGGANGSLILEWWLFDKELGVSGDAMIGFYNDHYGRCQFVIGYKTVNGNKSEGHMAYIGSDGLTYKDL